MVDQAELRFFSDFTTELIDQVAGMGHILRLFKLPPARLPEGFPDTGLQLRELAPGLQRLGIIAERGDARGYQVLVTGFGHQRELPGYDGHGRQLRDHIAVVSDAAASRMVLGFMDILAQHIPADAQEPFFGTREKTLADTAPDIEPMVGRDFLLIVRPYFLFSLIDHNPLLKWPGEQWLNV